MEVFKAFEQFDATLAPIRAPYEQMFAPLDHIDNLIVKPAADAIGKPIGKLLAN
jgi:hypothetical protein